MFSIRVPLISALKKAAVRPNHCVFYDSDATLWQGWLPYKRNTFWDVWWNEKKKNHSLKSDENTLTKINTKVMTCVCFFLFICISKWIVVVQIFLKLCSYRVHYKTLLMRIRSYVETKYKGQSLNSAQFTGYIHVCVCVVVFVCI